MTSNLDVIEYSCIHASDIISGRVPVNTYRDCKETGLKPGRLVDGIPPSKSIKSHQMVIGMSADHLIVSRECGVTGRLTGNTVAFVGKEKVPEDSGSGVFLG